MQEQKRAERRMLAAIFFFWFSVYTYPSFLSSYSTEKLMATSVTAGMIVGSYGLTQMVLRIPFGVLSDSLKKRKMFVMLGFIFSLLASFGLSAVSLFAAWEHVPGWLPAAALICRGLSGVTAATWVNFSVLYSSGYKGEEVAAAMSRIAVPQMGSQIFAMLLGAQLADHFGEAVCVFTRCRSRRCRTDPDDANPGSEACRRAYDDGQHCAHRPESAADIGHRSRDSLSDDRVGHRPGLCPELGTRYHRPYHG